MKKINNFQKVTKKTISLFLALVMFLGTLVPLVPESASADGEEYIVHFELSYGIDNYNISDLSLELKSNSLIDARNGRKYISTPGELTPGVVKKISEDVRVSSLEDIEAKMSVTLSEGSGNFNTIAIPPYIVKLSLNETKTEKINREFGSAEPFTLTWSVKKSVKDAKIDELEEQIKKLQAEKTALEEKANKVEKENEELKGKLQEAEKKVEELENSLKEKEARIANLEKQLEEANKKDQDNQAKIDELKEKLESCKDNGEKLKQEKARLEEEIRDKDKKIAQLNKEIEDLKNSNNDELIAEITQLKDELKRLQDENAKLKEDYSSTKWELEAEKEKTDKNENKIKEMQEKLESLEGELAKKTKEIEDKDNRIKDLEKALDEKDTKIKQLEEANKKDQDNQAKIDELEEQIKKLQAEKTALEEKANKVEKENEDLKKQKEADKEKLAKLEKELEEVNKTELNKPSQTNKLERIAGKDRVETAVEVSKRAYDKSDVVILANGYDGMVDALTVAPLAKKLNAPILLANLNSVTKATLDEMARLGATKLIIIGGESRISKALAESFNKLDVQRIAGKDRVETAIEIAKVLNPTTEKYILANGINMVDALTASSLAMMSDMPILLSDKTSAELPKKAKELLVVGGEYSISKEITDTLVKEGKTVERIAGKDRVETALKIAERFNNKADTALVVNAESMVDALTASALVMKLNAPIILTDTNGNIELPKNVKEAIIIGGEDSVIKEVEKNIKTALGL